MILKIINDNNLCTHQKINNILFCQHFLKSCSYGLVKPFTILRIVSHKILEGSVHHVLDDKAGLPIVPMEIQLYRKDSTSTASW